MQSTLNVYVLSFNMTMMSQITKQTRNSIYINRLMLENSERTLNSNNFHGSKANNVRCKSNRTNVDYYCEARECPR